MGVEPDTASLVTFALTGLLAIGQASTGKCAKLEREINMNTQEIWNCEKKVTELLGVTQPEWIAYDLTAMDIASICNGGCASGSYMPAVTYWKASATMADHGDDVLDYIVEQLGELPAVPKFESWRGMACLFLSTAVELWAGSVMAQLEDLELEGED